MGIELVVSVLGIVVATAISVWTYRKINPKRQLRYRVEVTPLLTAGTTAAGRLTIALDGRPVSDPRIVMLSLWSTGRADIASSAFDAGTPLTFELGARLVEKIPADQPSMPTLEVIAGDKVVLRPALLHRKFQSTIRVIVDGEPMIGVNHVLPDIEVIRDGASETAHAIVTSRRRLRVTPLLLWTGALVLGLFVLVVGLIIYSFDQDAYLPWGVVGIFAMMISLAAIVVIGIYRFIRWLARNVEARSGLRGP